MGSVITSKKGLLKLVNGQIDIEVDGSKQPAKDGEQLPKGAVLNIGENATYEITFDDGTKLSNEVEPNTTAAVAPTANNDAAFDEIQALQDLIASGEDPTKNLPETAAGNTPGRDGNSGYVTLARGGSEIIASSGYSTSGQSFAATVINTPEQTIATDSPSILNNDSNIVDEDTIASGNVLDNDSDVDSILSVVSFEINGTTYAAGTEVALESGSLVLNADGSYTFTPNENWNGQVPVITYTTNTGASTTLTINITPVDDPSIITNDSTTVAEDTVATGNVLDNDSDVDSTLSVVSFEVGGTTYASGTEVALEGGILVLNTDGSYTFTPNENWNGQVPVITYTTNTGSSATLTINVTPVADGGPSVTINTDTNNDGFISNEELAGNTEVNVTIGLDGTGANVGDTLTVNGVDYTLTQEDINNGFVNLNLLAPGEGETITVVATITDSAGNTSPEGSDSALLDTTAPTITVDAPDETQDTTPTITGSTDAPPGSTITIVVTDSTGAEQTLTTTVNPDGTYSVDVISPLAEGPITATATVTDPAGNTGTATDDGNVDITAPNITVDAPDNTQDTTPTITGSSNATPGSAITIVVTDNTGAEQTLTTTVNEDGTYAVDVTTPLAEGDYTAVATVKDPAGNTGKATDNGNVDTQIDQDGDGNTVAITSITDDTGASGSDFITNDNTLVFNGTVDLGDNSTLAVTINGVVYTTANGLVIDVSGNWSIDLTDSELADGTYPVSATVTDLAGNSKTVTQDVVIDTAAPSATITVDNITSDDVLNAQEAAGDVTVTGTVGGDAAIGDTVTMVINGTTYTTTVIALTTGGLGFSLPVAGSDLALDTTFTATVSGSDDAGNPFTADTVSTHTVDGSASATITVDNITSDDVLNAQEAAGDVTVTGTVGGDAAIGDTVTMVINGTTYTTTVIALTTGG
ncbi:retention module-containing protein [Shewanella glacialipiscicola]|uniref:Retention module-containing protein n=2 Tax=Shewanella glacialipiscicola TaxID=614069 RepID=A0ABQ6IZ59_9GAMM|nr:retention module-containing protein [Shewanella glacialipiscicola]GMA80493.1 hypothetical protein GCM10025855_00260 [Shewanella glacialipiscicola]